MGNGRIKDTASPTLGTNCSQKVAMAKTCQRSMRRAHRMAASHMATTCRGAAAAMGSSAARASVAKMGVDRFLTASIFCPYETRSEARLVFAGIFGYSAFMATILVPWRSYDSQTVPTSLRSERSWSSCEPKAFAL